MSELPLTDFEEALGPFCVADARIGDLLVDAGIVSREDVERAASVAASTHRRLGEVLVDRHRLPERDVFRQLARQRGMEFSDQEGLRSIADPSLARAVARKFLEHHFVLPIAKRAGTLVVATCNPEVDVPELSQALDADDVEYHLVTPTDYRRLLMAIDLGLTGLSGSATQGADDVPDLLAPPGLMETQYTSVFDALLLEAIAERASDIHVERYGDRCRVRIRIDGDLFEAPRFNLRPYQYVGLINVIKIKANLDIAEHRVPQGGRFSAAAGGKSFDLRVQTQPSLHGEHVVIRLLPKKVDLIDIDQLGLPPEIAKTYRRLLDSPSGLILVVGPTGSGKSTTLYAGISALAKDTTRKVITVEDPIESSIENIQQTQVRPDLGFGFANAVRAFVREDPDVILVGEIRDSETAQEALRASQTGHVVLSTLHCNDTVDAVQRMLDLGMHENSIAGELLAVFAQRLARRNCPSCRRLVKPDPGLLSEVFPNGAPADFRCFAGAGCSHCNGHGAYGRIAVVEYLPASPVLRKAISRRMPLDELRELARKANLVPMRQHALSLVHEGTIALDELPAMFSQEQLAGT
ncbi:MAG: Flp pilus assembly complex ATPase component TadA [Blastocatellia bacterium]|jgi:type IV pilus assembly protein PilB|nr:Flp pilus assembly complex ATPase component TadA [Blastocatellia bacterium]MBK6426428.1 Flp pilus assembly complex ATPase component TadA [Blastocatellia bacterium]